MSAVRRQPADCYSLRGMDPSLTALRAGIVLTTIVLLAGSCSQKMPNLHRLLRSGAAGYGAVRPALRETPIVELFAALDDCEAHAAEIEAKLRRFETRSACEQVTTVLLDHRSDYAKKHYLEVFFNAPRQGLGLGPSFAGSCHDAVAALPTLESIAGPIDTAVGELPAWDHPRLDAPGPRGGLASRLPPHIAAHASALTRCQEGAALAKLLEFQRTRFEPFVAHVGREPGPSSEDLAALLVAAHPDASFELIDSGQAPKELLSAASTLARPAPCEHSREVLMTALRGTEPVARADACRCAHQSSRPQDADTRALALSLAHYDTWTDRTPREGETLDISLPTTVLILPTLPFIGWFLLDDPGPKHEHLDVRRACHWARPVGSFDPPPPSLEIFDLSAKRSTLEVLVLTVKNADRSPDFVLVSTDSTGEFDGKYCQARSSAQADHFGPCRDARERLDDFDYTPLGASPGLEVTASSRGRLSNLWVPVDVTHLVLVEINGHEEEKKVLYESAPMPVPPLAE